MIVNTQLENKGNLFPGKVHSFYQDVDKIYFKTENGVILQVTILRGSVIRFRYATDNNLDNDFSYAISKKGVRGYNKLEVIEHDTHYKIKTKKIIIEIHKADLKTAITDIFGNVICKDDLGFHWEQSYEFGA